MEQNFSYGFVEDYGNQVALLQDIYRLRYRVYVNEWGFEDTHDHPDKMETDEYDRCSIHYYVRCRSDNQIIGTVRIILVSELGFPVLKYFDIHHQQENIEGSRIGEISRLAVSKEFRRRAIDKAIFGGTHYDPKRIPRYMDEGRDFRRHCEHEIVRGLYMTMYADSKSRGLTHWYAVMARGLYVILKRWGITFDQVGPTKEYHGLRAPYLTSIEDVEKTVKKLNPVLLEHPRNLKFH